VFLPPDNHLHWNETNSHLPAAAEGWQKCCWPGSLVKKLLAAPTPLFDWKHNKRLLSVYTSSTMLPGPQMKYCLWFNYWLHYKQQSVKSKHQTRSNSCYTAIITYISYFEAQIFNATLADSIFFQMLHFCSGFQSACCGHQHRMFAFGRPRLSSIGVHKAFTCFSLFMQRQHYTCLSAKTLD